MDDSPSETLFVTMRAFARMESGGQGRTTDWKGGTYVSWVARAALADLGSSSPRSMSERDTPRVLKVARLLTRVSVGSNLRTNDRLVNTRASARHGEEP